ncbi:MAG: molybdopterin-dependent oxidoreductase, partial [Phycisphaerales bacterium]|nr:molybdopterin-dependent oxidoreductase [Phycisphaerales bacterium]
MTTSTLDLSRRHFIVGATAAGAGLSLGFSLPLGAAQAASATPEVNAWVVIEPDDTVIVRIARSEMGQGTLTGLAQLVAEELEADWSKVTTEYPTPGQNVARDRIWSDFATGGSRGIRASEQYVREGGAAARMMLIEAAANEWGVSASECSAAKSVITHQGSGRTTTYGAVAAAAAQLTPPTDIPLKDPKDWTIVGQPVKRLDTLDKLTGKQVYGADVRLDGMVNASVKTAPVRNAKLKSFDADAVASLPGVKKVMQLGDATVAVVADTGWRANSALEQMPIEWEGGDADFSSAEFEADLIEGMTAETQFVGNKAGDVEAAFASAAQVVEATYRVPHQSHACMEPMNATAIWTEDKCEVWCPTQNGEAALAAAVEASGLPIEKCDVYKLHLGGGFGRRGVGDYVTQAVTIAKTMPGTPVKLLWSREEDMQQDFYHPTTRGRIRGALDADGNLTGIHLRISGQSILAGIRPEALVDGADLFAFQGVLPSGLNPQ